jgi:bifunctional ADP-heptose synthase (sugar kinase/adenylyltransferase)
MVFLEQVDLANTGVLTREFLDAVGSINREHPRLLMIGDSRRGLGHFPPMALKMNRNELARLTGAPMAPPLAQAKVQAAQLALEKQRPVFVTLSEEGILGADVDGEVCHVPALPTRGAIDIVGAGDAVTANLAAALAAQANIPEAVAIANTAASVVIHQLGTTGTATTDDLRPLLVDS